MNDKENLGENLIKKAQSKKNRQRGYWAFLKNPFILLKNPFCIFMAMGLGIFIGFEYPNLAKTIAPAGRLYLSLLQMAVIPILISAIVSNVARLANSENINALVARMILIFVKSILIVSLFGVFWGVVTEPGKGLSQSQRDVLGKYTEKESLGKEIEVSLSGPSNKKEQKLFIDYFVDIVPQNIFKSLSTGKTVELVFFCIMLGIAVGLIKDYNSETFIKISTASFLAFQKIINWVMFILPFGLICLIAEQVRTTGIEIVESMVKLIIVFYLGAILLVFIYTILIWLRSKKPFLTVVEALFEPVMLAFTTRSSYATIPSSLGCLEKKLYFERSTTNLITPIGITLLRYGNIFYFAVMSMFIIQFYEVEFSAGNFFVLTIWVILAGIATAGATGFATINFISIALGPLGVPYQGFLPILYAMDPILDPMRTTLNVHGNIMCTALISKIYKGEKGERKQILEED